MQQLSERSLIGITVRTNNAAEMSGGKIGLVVQNYFQNQLAAQIPNRQNPGITYSAYTDYESDYTGDYTYFIGEEVASGTSAPLGFEKIIIPAQAYA
jgi:predicted transcriptional regulator YdeE